MSEGGGFLSRWSRRKRAAGVSAPPPPAAPALPEAAGPAAAPPAATGPAFDLASLPPLESLTAESDFAAFLREEVPAALRQAALRRAWTLDPAIRGFVGPADYAWDFNAADGMAGFSPELAGDVTRLLAQAIGLGEELTERTPEEEEAPSTAEATAPEVEPASLAADPAPLPEALQSVRPAEAPCEPAPDTFPAAAPPMAEPAPVRRRHGGALPT